MSWCLTTMKRWEAGHRISGQPNRPGPCTPDWDLWGTKVSGSDHLIGSLFADSDMEAVELREER